MDGLMPHQSKPEAPSHAVYRRTFLPTLACAAVPVAFAFPKVWVRPVVDSIMLPAHAQISAPPPCTLEFRTPGTYEFIVPTAANALTVTLSGGGGGGGGSRENDAGDGGDGELVNSSLTVTPGEVLIIVVGAGGIGGGKYDLPVTVRDGGFGGEGGGSSSIGSIVASGGGGGSGQGALPTPGSSGAGPAGGAGGIPVDLVPPVAVFEGRPGSDGGAGGGQSGGAGGLGTGLGATAGSDGSPGSDGYVLFGCVNEEV